MSKPLKQYPALLACLPIVVLLGIGLLNFIVDPYRIFSSDADGLYERYPALHPNLRLHKTYQVNHLKPDTIILGTSKAIQGIPLDHEYFNGKSVYNLAAPLASMRENYHLLLHAQANQPLKEVVFVVDFLSFNVLARKDGPAAGYSEHRLKHSGSSSIYWQDYLAATVSADALQASIAVLKPSAGSDHRVLNGRGGREDDEIASRLSDGGHRTNSQKIESFFVNSVLLAAPHRRFALSDEQDNSLEWYEKFINEAQNQGIKTTLLIGPSHMRYWELLNQGDLLPLFERWKRSLVEINQRVGVELGRTPFALWDFTLSNKISSEAFPEAGDSDYKMKYYYESVHFNQLTGGMILDRISKNNVSQLPSQFGILLDASNIDAISAQLREDLSDFRESEPQTVEELLQALP